LAGLQLVLMNFKLFHKQNIFSLKNFFDVGIFHLSLAPALHTLHHSKKPSRNIGTKADTLWNIGCW